MAEEVKTVVSGLEASAKAFGDGLSQTMSNLYDILAKEAETKGKNALLKTSAAESKITALEAQVKACKCSQDTTLKYLEALEKGMERLEKEIGFSIPGAGKKEETVSALDTRTKTDVDAAQESKIASLERRVKEIEDARDRAGEALKSAGEAFFPTPAQAAAPTPTPAPTPAPEKNPEQKKSS